MPSDEFLAPSGFLRPGPCGFDEALAATVHRFAAGNRLCQCQQVDVPLRSSYQLGYLRNRAAFARRQTAQDAGLQAAEGAAADESEQGSSGPEAEQAKETAPQTDPDAG